MDILVLYLSKVSGKSYFPISTCSIGNLIFFHSQQPVASFQFQFHPLPGACFGQKRIWCAAVAKNEFGSGWSSQIKSLTRLQPTLPADFLEHKKQLRIPGFMGKKVPWLPWCLGNPFFFLNWIISRSVDPSNLQDMFLKTPRMPLKTTQLATGNTTRKHPGCLFSKIPCRCLLNYTLQACWFRAASFLVRKKPNLYRKHTNWVSCLQINMNRTKENKPFGVLSLRSRRLFFKRLIRNHFIRYKVFWWYNKRINTYSERHGFLAVSITDCWANSISPTSNDCQHGTSGTLWFFVESFVWRNNSDAVQLDKSLTWEGGVGGKISSQVLRCVLFQMSILIT